MLHIKLEPGETYTVEDDLIEINPAYIIDEKLSEYRVVVNTAPDHPLAKNNSEWATIATFENDHAVLRFHNVQMTRLEVEGFVSMEFISDLHDISYVTKA